MLDLNSMRWTKMQHQERALKSFTDDRIDPVRFGGTVYKDYLVILRNNILSGKNSLCFFDLNRKNTWANFEIKGLGKASNHIKKDHIYRGYYFSRSAFYTDMVGTVMVYKNLILSFAKYDGKLVAIVMGLDHFRIPVPESAEEEHSSSLFLNQAESDFTFKVGDQLIPAHKQVLVKKSQHFMNLFNNGMVDSSQSVIEVQDCEYEVFKEYLRFIYQGNIDFDNEDKAIKLYILARQYLQEDLVEKCVNYLSHHINKNNFYKILDFALQENINEIKKWCFPFLQDHINILNVAEMIEYLNRQKDPQSRENNKKFRNQTFHFVISHFFQIEANEKGNMQVYENFLLKNIETDTISVLARFLSFSYRYEEKKFSDPVDNFKKWTEREGYSSPSQDVKLLKHIVPKRKDLFDERTMQLKEAALNFIQQNMKDVMTNEILKDIPKRFVRYFTQYSFQKASKQIQDLKMKAEMKEDSHENSERKEKKRMEPVQEGVNEENPILKKTKKSDSEY